MNENSTPTGSKMSDFISPVLKTCSKCFVPRSESAFYRWPNGHRSGMCNVCKRAYEVARYWADPKKSYARQRASLLKKTPEQIKVLKEKAKKLKLRKKYGLTPEMWRLLYVSQKGLCAICGLPPSTQKGLCIDHDHVTKAVRGLLCEQCNIAIGFLKDSPASAHSAGDYLSDPPGPKLLALTNCSAPDLPPVEARSSETPVPSCSDAPCSGGYRPAHCSASLLPTP